MLAQKIDLALLHQVHLQAECALWICKSCEASLGVLVISTRRSLIQDAWIALRAFLTPVRMCAHA